MPDPGLHPRSGQLPPYRSTAPCTAALPPSLVPLCRRPRTAPGANLLSPQGPGFPCRVMGVGGKGGGKSHPPYFLVPHLRFVVVKIWANGEEAKGRYMGGTGGGYEGGIPGEVTGGRLCAHYLPDWKGATPYPQPVRGWSTSQTGEGPMHIANLKGARGNVCLARALRAPGALLFY